MVSTVAFVTLGCPKNTVDSETAAALLEREGFRLIADAAGADAVIVNTCGFIEPARDESLGELRSLAEAKRPGQKLVAAGCLAELNPALLLAEVPGIDAILSTRRWPEIAALLRGLTAEGGRPVLTGDSPLPPLAVPRAPVGATAYVKVAEGCNGPCAFCTIPRIKGRLHSRAPDEVAAEVARLAEQGYKEVILVGQDTTSYGRDRGESDGLPGLLSAVMAAAPGLPWLRIMYTYPQHVSDRLLELMAASPQMCHYLDMPLQHAHPEVLRRMRRPADVDAVVRLIERARSSMPDIAIRTAFIVGYPGETRAEFQALLAFVRQVKLDHVGVFTYSREPGTPSYDLEPQVPEPVKEERRARLLEAQQVISLRINRSLVGKEYDVLLEGAGDGISVGRTFRDAPEVDGLAIIEGEMAPGQIVRARVTRGTEYDLMMRRL